MTSNLAPQSGAELQHLTLHQHTTLTGTFQFSLVLTTHCLMYRFMTEVVMRSAKQNEGGQYKHRIWQRDGTELSVLKVTSWGHIFFISGAYQRDAH